MPPQPDTKQIAALLAAMPEILRAEFAALDENILGWHPAPGEWCAKEVLGHIIEADRRGFVELRPWTDGRWGSVDMPGGLGITAFQDRRAVACRIEAQFPTLLGRPRLISVEIPADENPLIDQMWKLIAKGFGSPTGK